MKKNNSLLLLALLAKLSVAQNSNTGVNSIINFNAYMRQVKAQHPLAKKLANYPALATYQQKSAQGQFDPYVNSNLENKFFSGTNYYTTAVAEIKQGLYSGQTIKAGFEYGQGAYLNPEENTKANPMPYVGLEVSLLQGLVIDKRRYEVQKSNHYKNLLNTEGSMYLNDLLLNAGESYIDWLKNYTLVEINKRFVETASKRFQGLIALSAIGEKPAIDTVESAILIQSREIDYGYARVEFNKARYALNRYEWENDLNLPVTELLPEDKLMELQAACFNNFLKYSNLNVENNPGIKYYQYKTELLKLEKKYKAEQIKPKLDIRYNLLVNNTAQNTYLYSNNYKWGVGFSMPVFLRNPLNEFKISRLNLQNNQYELNNKTTELKSKLNALQSNLLILASQIQLAKKTLQYTGTLMEAEKVKFSNNESSLFLLNTRESKMLESEVKLVELAAKFIQSYLQYIYLTGSMNYEI